jgi:hypothetical protein
MAGSGAASSGGDVRVLRRRSAIAAGAWFILALGAIDLAINIIFAFPQNPRLRPGHLQAYFEYGRSIEGQLRRMTRVSKDDTAPITLSGWYHPLEVKEFSSKSPANRVVTFYGSSQAVELAAALSRVSVTLTPRSVGAPGATSNWAYGAYLRDRGGGKSYAVVLAFQSSNLAMITSFSPMNWAIDAPMPYTADRFFLDGGLLRVIHPPYTSFEEYTATLSDPQKWARAREFFAKEDPLYRPLLFRESVLDHSALFRLARRAFGQHVIRNFRNDVLDQSGFKADSEGIRVAKSIIHQFAAAARREGELPIVYLVNDLGYSDYLAQALVPTLVADSILYLNSDTLASANDPRAFQSDGHFTPQIAEGLARALESMIVQGSKLQTVSGE